MLSVGASLLQPTCITSCQETLSRPYPHASPLSRCTGQPQSRIYLKLLSLNHPSKLTLCCHCANSGVAPAQDVSGGAPVAVEGTELPLWGMEIDVERAKAELKELGQAGTSAGGGGSKVDDFMSGVGLGALQEQLKDLRLSAPFMAPHLAIMPRQCRPAVEL